MRVQRGFGKPPVYHLEDEELEFLKGLFLVLQKEKRMEAWNRLVVERMMTSEIGVELIHLFYRVERRREENATIYLPPEYEEYRSTFSPTLYLRYKALLREVSFFFANPSHFHLPTNLLQERASCVIYPNGAILKRGTPFPSLGLYDDLWYEDESSPGVPVDFDDYLDNQVLYQKEGLPMELQDTVSLMTSADFQDRFKAEYQQLKIRAQKLRTMLDAMKDGTLKFDPKCDYDLLHEQLVYMQAYLGILERRATTEGISLLWLNNGAPKSAS